MEASSNRYFLHSGGIPFPIFTVGTVRKSLLYLSVTFGIKWRLPPIGIYFLHSGGILFPPITVGTVGRKIVFPPVNVCTVIGTFGTFRRIIIFPSGEDTQELVLLKPRSEHCRSRAWKWLGIKK